jgi:hypothetical protein
MNPLELQSKLAPLLGDDVARALARVADAHKTGADFPVTVRSGLLVQLAEKLAEKA